MFQLCKQRISVSGNNPNREEGGHRSKQKIEALIKREEERRKC